METETGAAAPKVEVADQLVDEASISDGKAIVRFDRTAAALADLTKRFKGAAFDLTTTRGNDAARAARRELTSLRTGLEAKRKSLKGPAVEFGRLIDSQAMALKIAIEALEDPIDLAIKVDEQRREDERQAKIAAEQKRCDDHRARIADISAVATRAVGLPSAEIQTKIDLVTRIEIDASFEEFEAAAGNVKHETLLALKDLHARALATEEEAARVAADRARLQQLERENAEREAAQRAEQQRKAEEEQRVRAAEQAAAAARHVQSNLARDLIEEIRVIQSRAFTSSAAGMLELVGLIEGIKIGSEIGDFEGSAQKAREDALVTLHMAHGQAVTREAEAKELRETVAKQEEELAIKRRADAIAAQNQVHIGIDGGGVDDQFAVVPYVAFDISQPIESLTTPTPEGGHDARIGDVLLQEFSAADSAKAWGSLEAIPAAANIRAAEEVASKYDTSNTAPMLSTGDIGRRLGLDTALPVATIEGVLGVPRAGQEKRAVLWRASQWPAIVDALVRHIESVR